MFSFAELLRSAAKTYLDIDESELEVGLQPAKIRDTVTSRVFLADALDNGAGYALELGQSGSLDKLLASLRSDTGARLRADAHASACTSSCPGCLRNYENRFHHWALDWRLGLDIVDLALGLEVDETHWWSRAPELTHAFRQAFRPYGQLTDETINDVPVLFNNEGRGSAVVLGHALWRHDSDNWHPRVADAVRQLRHRAIGKVSVSDLYVLDRTPFNVFSLLA
jgi:DEAD/DEAH box helicase domain-containing protein